MKQIRQYCELSCECGFTAVGQGESGVAMAEQEYRQHICAVIKAIVDVAEAQAETLRREAEPTAATVEQALRRSLKSERIRRRVLAAIKDTA